MRGDKKAFLAAAFASITLSAHAVEITPSGRLHLDYAQHDSDVAQFEDRFLVRRAQLGLEAKFNNDWSAKLVYDFAGGGSIKDAYLRYDGWKLAEITLGQFKVPLGLEQLTSTNDMSFVERALPSTAFTLSRRKGIGFETHGKNYTVAAMGFVSSIGGNQGHGAAARFTFTPLHRGDTLTHLGLSASTERPTEAVSFGTRPESLPTDIRLVKTGTVRAVTRIDRLGVETAWQKGPFSVQGEWMRTHLTRNSNKPDVHFSGWYIASSYVLTGESRGYHNGVFKSITPGSASGAWELTARYSQINLNDGPVRGGNQHDLTLGVNWYFREDLRIMANYIKVSSDRRGISDDPNIVDLRIQLAF